MGKLLAQLRRASVNGVVPEEAFVRSVRGLGLGQAEQDRLRGELARLGMPVRNVRVHVDADSPDVEKVALIREENVSHRAGRARVLLARYEDADGYVTSRALEGVIRLAGLTVREAGELRAAARVWGAVAPGPEVESEPDEPEAPGPESRRMPEPERSGVAAPEGALVAGPEVPQEAGDVAVAMAAALAVLDEDRFLRRPERRLLTAEAEVGLAVLLRGGTDRMSREPDAEELSALPSGHLRVRARDCLVVHNQRLVHSLVRSHLDQGLDYDDLFQAGALGLMRAARKFDPAKGNKFSTYATWWIRQQITRAIADEGALIRIPVHMHEQMRKVAAAERALAAQGLPATAVDVAVRCDMSVRKVEEIRKLSRRTDSLDRVIGDGATLGDFVGEREALPSAEHGVISALLMEDVMSVVDTFTEREARVLVRRLGLDGDEPSTLEELGREFGVTRERIRQVASKALVEFKRRLRLAGVIDVYAAGEEQEADGDGGQAGTRKRPGRCAGGAATTAHGADKPSARGGDTSARVGEQPPSADAEAAVAVEGAETEGSTEDVAEQKDSDAPEPSPIVEDPVPHDADWEQAQRMSARFHGGIDWLARYVLLALGVEGLKEVLGPTATLDVVHAARGLWAPSRSVLSALEVLQRVFDVLKEAGLRPEDFFERPAEALVGLTPHDFLTRKPLVYAESRLAVRDALRELSSGLPKGGTVSAVGVTEADDGPAAAEGMESAVADGEYGEGTEARGAEPAVTEATPEFVAADEAEHRDVGAESAGAGCDHEQQSRRALEARVIAAEAEAERQLDALEDAFLRRMDKAFHRRERQLCAEFEERITHLEREHHEACQELVRRAEQAEEAARIAAEELTLHRIRADETDRQLRQYRDGAEERIAQLEAQLRQTWAALAERDDALHAARQQVEAAQNAAVDPRTSLWGRWRRT